MAHATPGSLGGEPVSANVCPTLRVAAESAQAPYFFEALVQFSRQTIPGGEQYKPWRASEPRPWRTVARSTTAADRTSRSGSGRLSRTATTQNRATTRGRTRRSTARSRCHRGTGGHGRHEHLEGFEQIGHFSHASGVGKQRKVFDASSTGATPTSRPRPRPKGSARPLPRIPASGQPAAPEGPSHARGLLLPGVAGSRRLDRRHRPGVREESGTRGLGGTPSACRDDARGRVLFAHSDSHENTSFATMSSRLQTAAPTVRGMEAGLASMTSGDAFAIVFLVVMIVVVRFLRGEPRWLRKSRGSQRDHLSAGTSLRFPPSCSWS